MEHASSGRKEISAQALYRLPFYLNYLKRILAGGAVYISSPKIASELGQNEVQVRKDLAAVSTCGGKPKTGYEVKRLICDIESFLGYDNVDETVVVGVGSLGKALLNYKGFEECGLNIVAGFDIRGFDEIRTASEKPVFPVGKMKEICRRLNIHIGILSVPAACAQQVCDELVSCGVLAILNFAPVHLTAPPGILIQNVNLAASLAVLSAHLRKQIEEKTH